MQKQKISGRKKQVHVNVWLGGDTRLSKYLFRHIAKTCAFQVISKKDDKIIQDSLQKVQNTETSISADLNFVWLISWDPAPRFFF